MGSAVYVLGSSGFGGGELLRLLHQHPEVTSIRVASKHYAGRPVADAHPHLRGLLDISFDAEPAWQSLLDSPRPVVFSAMPHFELARNIEAFESAWNECGLGDKLTVIDLSGDFRLDDRVEFEKAYGRPHPDPERLGTFVYGLPEWNHARICEARRIANPGCFATAIQLALLPLAGIDSAGLIAVSAATGSSGSGAVPSSVTHHPTRAHDFRAYKVLAHQHRPEIVRLLQREKVSGFKLGFVPHSAPIVRGIFATIQLHVGPQAGLSEEELGHRFARRYAAAPFVRLVHGSPRVASVLGSNFCELTYFERDGHVVVLAALDNLVKGMAGQAIQNMNLALGYPETAGLSHAAIYPV